MLCLPDPTGSFFICKMIEGVRRKVGTKRNTHFPISREHLWKLMQLLKSVWSSSYESSLFAAAFSLSFFVILLVGEITSDSHHNKGVHTISYHNVTFIGDELHLTIRSSKSDQHGNKVILVLKSQVSDSCPVHHIRHYVETRCSLNPLLPLFIHFDASAFTRFQFTSVLQKLWNFEVWQIEFFLILSV